MSFSKRLLAIICSVHLLIVGFYFISVAPAHGQPMYNFRESQDFAPRPTNAKGMLLQGGLVSGKGVQYIVRAPKGWAMDHQAGQTDGLDVVFYPASSSWDTSITTMAIQLKDINKNHKQAASDLLLQTQTHLEMITEGLMPDKPETIRTADNKKITIHHLNSNRNCYSLAIIDEKKMASLLTLTVKDSRECKPARDAFKRLIASYVRMYGTVEGKKPLKE